MKVAALLILAVASTSAVSEPAHAQAVQSLAPSYLVVQRGHAIKLGNYSSVDPDCHVIGRTQINLLIAPQGGQIETENGFDFPQFNSNNVRFACNKRRLATTIVYYRAARDFTGTDTFTFEGVFPNGYASQYRYTVNVR